MRYRKFSHDSLAAPLRTAHLTTVMAPMIRSRRMSRCDGEARAVSRVVYTARAREDLLRGYWVVSSGWGAAAA
jgi:hypothetical protein